MFMHFIIMLHLALAFLESPVNFHTVLELRAMLTQRSYLTVLYLVEGFCMVVHFLDFGMVVYTEVGAN
jgi:hypothetical protein